MYYFYAKFDIEMPGCVFMITSGVLRKSEEGGPLRRSFPPSVPFPFLKFMGDTWIGGGSYTLTIICCCSFPNRKKWRI